MALHWCERGARGFCSQLIVSNSSVGNYWRIEAFQWLAAEWEVFERSLYEALNQGCCFCFPKQTDIPPLLKELSTPGLWPEFLKFWAHLWTEISHMFVGSRCLSWDKLLLSSAIKEVLVSVWKQIRPTELTKSPRLHPISSWQPSSLWGHFGLSPNLYPLLSSVSTSLPFRPLIGVQERRGEGSQGQSLFLFGSRGLLGEAWQENGCIRAGVGGQDFNFVKEQLVWVSPHVAFPSLSPQIQGDEKFVQRGTSKIKKVYSPKPLPLPWSSIREECNNVSIWPQSDWLKTRKSFLFLGVLTAWWNFKWGWIFHTWKSMASNAIFNMNWLFYT